MNDGNSLTSLTLSLSVNMFLFLFLSRWGDVLVWVVLEPLVGVHHKYLLT